MGHYRDKYPDVVKWWDVTNEVMGWNNKFNSDGILWTNIGTNPELRADYLQVAFPERPEATSGSPKPSYWRMNDLGK